jgi:hypothetical protein
LQSKIFHEKLIINMSEYSPNSSGSYEPYTPSELDEDGNSPLTNWEQERNKVVRNHIKLGRLRGPRSVNNQPITYGRMTILPGGGEVDKHLLRSIRRHFDPEFRRRERLKERLILGSVAAVGLAAITGVVLVAVDETNRPPLESFTPTERFSFDYSEPGTGAADCFTDTAYDLEAGNQGKMSVTPPSSSYDSELDILTITPVSGNNSIRLTGLEQYDHTLTPVGKEDHAIFNSYGCRVEEY